MKGYRKLAPGEVIREGDVCAGYLKPREARAIDVGQKAIEREAAYWWRKARTDGCPPGWRWADAGERSLHWVDPEWSIIQSEDGRCPDGDAFLRPAMPYPEDPRLEEE